MIKINNHWDHWRAHIIIFGVDITTMEKYELDYIGLEICLFGFGIQLYQIAFIDWLLVKVWQVPKENLIRECSVFRKTFKG